MLHKKLFIQIIFRVILIVLNSVLLSYLYMNGKYPVTQINLLLFLVAQTIFLISFLNKANRDLSRFFDSITNQDYSLKVKESISDKSFKNLKRSIEKVSGLIEEGRIAQIEHYEYLKNVVEHIGVGILSYDEQFKIEFFNPAGKNILEIEHASILDDIERIIPDFIKKIDLMPNQQKLITLTKNQKEIPLTTKLVEFKLSDKKVKLLSFQNIKLELDYNEIESWQKIIRVLTHEIMNSVSPISSATKTISKLYQKEEASIEPNLINTEIIEKTLKGMKIINQRSEGMLKFVDKFRDLTLIPEPQVQQVAVNDIIQSISTLFEKDLTGNKIGFKIAIYPSNLLIKGDQSQLEQVLINLVKNSIESFSNEPIKEIDINAFINKNLVVIEIKDTGPGIPPEVLNQVFIPFFTTKESGSGVGLSLSRQIILNHKGSIVIENMNNGCKVTISLPMN